MLYMLILLLWYPNLIRNFLVFFCEKERKAGCMYNSTTPTLVET